MKLGASGRIAHAFLHSKLTPLLTVAALGMGLVGVVATPREEEPQISVPMIDVMTSLPGSPPREVEQLVTRPLERLMWEIPAVDHVYSLSGDGYALVTVRFKVGEDQERSITRVQSKLAAASQQMPYGANTPAVQAHSIDDVPVMALTLSSPQYSSDALRQIALQLEDDIRSVVDVAATSVIGGQGEQVLVQLDGQRLTARSLSAGDVVAALQGANSRLQLGEMALNNQTLRIASEGALRSLDEIRAVTIVSRSGALTRISDVADVRMGSDEVLSYVSHADSAAPPSPAVTIAIAKRRGANATTVTGRIRERVEHARSRLIPQDVSISVSRDYGETAADKAEELILHLFIATLSVTVLVLLFLGWREALTVLIAVPVTLGLTLFAYYALGYTLNRITLFALIFSIGILVDDAIVVVENIYRHMIRGDRPADRAAVEAVDEVGNPTILATLTVIAAILPMAVVSGLMGPYMRPIPVGASFAMIASLAVAFIVTPYFALRLLRGHVTPLAHAPDRAHEPEERGSFAAIYSRFMAPLVERRGRRYAVYGGTILLLLGSMALLATRSVEVKMLPFDNKSEFQVIVDLPEGTPLEMSQRAGDAMATYLRSVPEVASTEVYAGIAAPFNFNGLVRHYFLRRGSNVVDVQVNLKPKDARDRQSHAIAVGVRSTVDSIARQFGASAKVAEIPPGPPVLSTLVAEVYAADDSTRLQTARVVKGIFESTAGVVDIDWTIEDPQHAERLVVDRVAAARAGVSAEQITNTIYAATAGISTGLRASTTALEPEPIIARLPADERSRTEQLLALPINTPSGTQPLARFVRVEAGVAEGGRIRKDLRPAIYVTGDVAGTIESPVYAIMAMNARLDSLARASGSTIQRYNAIAPNDIRETAIKWDGEWQVTIEVFRDLGLAFAGVLVLIYFLVVGWFQSFKIPLVIMAPIPLTLIGILPGHAIGGAFFTATSMIGMIALAGIIVRNSILLVDFIQLAEERGRSLREAVIEAGEVRFRPIALTAAAVVIGGLVMILDPIFQGLAVSLISGAVVATVLTMVLVPLLYWEFNHTEAATRKD